MTKVAQRQRAQDILKRYDFGQSLQGDDLAFMLTLLRQHPRAQEKIGVGIASIEIRRHPVYRTSKVPTLVRLDGSSIDFSYQKCLDGEPNALGIFLATARFAISQEMFEYKREYFGDCETAPCQLSGDPITFHEAHVDHLPPVFDTIARQFIDACGIDVEAVAYTNGIGKEFQDQAFTEQWRSFHRERARLRVISAKLNMQMGKNSQD